MNLTHFFNRNRIALLGTLLFHFFVITIFSIVTVPPGTGEEYKIITISFPEDQAEDINPELKKYMQQFNDEGNRAVNEDAPKDIKDGKYNKYNTEPSNASKEKIEDDIEKQLKDLEDQVIQEQRNEGKGYTVDEAEALITSAKEKSLEKVKEQKPRSEAAYKGATNIRYKLENRYDVYLKVPVYLCQFGGIVTVNIAVNRSGEVVQAKVDKESSQTKDPCLVKAALLGAYYTKFNVSQGAPKIQKGSITYKFVAQ